MSYQELVAAFDNLREPFGELGTVYQRSSDQIAAAAPLDPSGSVTIFEGAMRAILADIVPPGSSDRYDQLTKNLEKGFIRDGSKLVAPWAALTEPEVFAQFDATVWQFLGFLRGSDQPVEESGSPARSYPFEGLDGVPDSVTAPENMASLYATAATTNSDQRPYSVLSSTTGARLTHLVPVRTGGPAISTGTPVRPTMEDVGTSTQALSSDDLAGLEACLNSIDAGWDNPFVLRLCIGKECADALQQALDKGLDKVMSKVLPVLTGGLTAVLGAIGGWVGLAIALSAAYWFVWILATKTANGVCLHIPMPWSLGVIGPGWATGR